MWLIFANNRKNLKMMEAFRKYEHLQLEEVCRICLTKKEQMNLISESGLADMLFECASIQVEL